MGRLSIKDGASIVLFGFILTILGAAMMPTIASQTNASEVSLDAYDYTEASDIWHLIPLMIAISGVLFIIGGAVLTFV